MKRAAFLVTLVLAILSAPALAGAQGPTVCTMQYDPVCGTENGVYKTYGNSCVLSAKGAVYQHEGECTAAELKGLAGGEVYVPPAHCTAWFDGCNRCGRSEDGQAYCTLMACMGEPRAGYCTAYGDTRTEEAPAVPDEGVTSSETLPLEPGVGVEATTSTETDVGFFFTLWNRIRAWFAGLF